MREVFEVGSVAFEEGAMAHYRIEGVIWVSEEALRLNLLVEAWSALAEWVAVDTTAVARSFPYRGNPSCEGGLEHLVGSL